VHLIQLHYPDTPADDKVSFRADTKKYMVDTLNGIKKGDKDIVITAAHSRLGFFYNQLNSKERKVLVDKCDLVLSATTHVFMRMRTSDYKINEPLLVNTGSITHARGFCPNGYIQVHVLENPLSLVVQYQNAKKEKREFASSYYAWIKKIGGEVIATDFKKALPKNDVDTTEKSDK